MPRLAIGDPAPPFELPAADGSRFDSRALLGRTWLLSFHRYAT
jgi:peroxiredoxin